MAGAETDARSRMLGRIRRGLKRGPLPESVASGLTERLKSHPRNLIPARSRIPRAEQLALWKANIVKEHGTVAEAASEAEIPGLVADYLASQNIPPVVRIAPDPSIAALPWGERPLLSVAVGRAEAQDTVSVTPCFAAVAETGTMFFPSGPHHPTTLNIMPETQIVVLRQSRIVGAYEEVWDLLRREQGSVWDGPTGTRFMPRNVMLVTGPSRTADIEQTIELGAHGPRRVHVILLKDEQP
ncbi:LutC/YkgG family protein [Elioraea rosea]|uniref:LutC/YkgG family protein n=1 Tax=Elioraea rosea TaxID=2492390 RepID=UPI0011842995|nr:lactate utilization protein [Elioraea rosea]